MLELITEVYAYLQGRVLQVLLYPLTPGQRIFGLYLISALLFAFLVYYRRGLAAGEDLSVRGFRRFLLPRSVWSHPSAWLDVRYFFFHQLFLVSVGGIILGSFTGFAYDLLGEVNRREASVGFSWLGVVYMFFLVALVDFAAFLVHMMQHRIPLLWEFHKVHHSAEVMHPLTNYREHPVDNIVYLSVVGFSYGAGAVVFSRVLGYVPSMPLVLGLPALMFAFNFLGYNLRHSHIWLRWPDPLCKVFGCPAHHHIHHSYHPDHIDKNFAFLFPFWDLLFGTYHLPKSNEHVRFGISSTYQTEFHSCLQLYWVPFRNAWRLLSERRKETAARTAREQSSRIND